MASPYASSRVREVEHRSTSACVVESASVAIPDNRDDYDNDGCGGGVWKLVVAAAGNAPEVDAEKNDVADVEDDDYWGKMADDAAAGGGEPDGGGAIEKSTKSTKSTKTTTLVECRAMAHGTTNRVPPMERTSGGWSPDHFHERLRLPESAKAGRGMIVLLESRSSECLAVALSPYHDYELGRTYVVHFGADGNTRTVLRRHVNYVECVEMSMPSRACSEDAWIPYWIILQGGKLSAGVGRVPGTNCVGTLDDSMYDALRSGVDAVRYVGIGNSALRRNARDLRARNVVVMGIPPHFGLGGVPIEDGGGGFVNVLDLLPSSGDGRDDRANDAGGVAPTDAELLAEYERERTKARSRAAKFGIEYKEPAADAFLRWSEARRLRANPERGFITGIDTFSAEEVAKADARRRRFATTRIGGGEGEGRKRRGGGGGGDEDVDENDEDSNDDDDEDEDEAMDDDGDDIAEWEKTKSDPLPVEQAWENWKLVRRFRVDPPSSSSSAPNDSTSAVDGAADGVGGKGGFAANAVVVVPTKIHVFSIDWAPFKQIRTDDLMSYFRDYGPSYVEWLGELSCNVLFEDRHSAARAFRALSRELPSPPPQAAVGTLGAAYDSDGGGGGGGGGEDAMGDDRVATTDDDDGEMKAIDAAAVVDDDGGDGHGKVQLEEGETPPDYGSMGWRFCKWTVRKVSNDRYGRRGTRARILMRLATSVDVLDDRPTEWPKPPPGFTTKRVLMPWHDFSGRRRGGGRGGGGRRDNKRRKGGNDGGGRRGGGAQREDERANVELRLSKGLRSGRSGFSVEELEAERIAKNAAILS